MMTETTRIGKSPVLSPVLNPVLRPVLSLVLTLMLVLLPAVLPPRASGAQPDHSGEAAWWLLEQGHPAEAARTAAGTDLLSRWIRATARHAGDETFAPREVTARAAVAFENKDFSTAAGLLEAMVLADTTDVSGAADALHRDLRLGACYVELGRIEEAEALLTAAIVSARRLERSASECYGLLTRGRARVRLRQVEPPRADLRAARELAVTHEAHEWAGVAAIALSVVSRLQMDLEDALRWRRQALEHFRAAGSLPGQARALHYIATIEIMQGDLTRAMTRLQDADALALAAGAEAQHGAIMGEMAAVNYHLGDFERALAQYREAVRLAPNPWRRGMMLVNIGSILEYRRQTAAAIPVLQEALELMRAVGDHRTETQALQSLGEAHIELGHFAEGLAALDDAIATAREFDIPLSEASALEIRGQGLLKKGDLQGAREAFAEAIARSRQIGYFDSLVWALLGHAQVERASGRPEQALRDLEDALQKVAAVRRRSGGAGSVTGGITGQADGIYGEMIDLLYDLHTSEPAGGFARRAYAVVQEARARAFLDLMTEAEFDLNVSAVPGYQEQEREILARIVDLETRLQKAAADSTGPLKAGLATAENELELLAARVRDADPRYAAILYPDPERGDPTRLLGPDEVLLEYRLGRERSFLWVVTREGLRMTVLPARAVIEDALQEFLPLLWDYNLTGPEAAWYIPGARRLHTMLVAPAAPEVQAHDRLLICPDGLLHYLPFGTLLTKDTTARSFAELPWLARDRLLAYVPSMAIAERLRNAAPVTGQTWLLVGDPVLAAGEDAGLFAHAAGAADLPALPFAQRELALVEQAASHDVRRLTGAAHRQPWPFQRGPAPLFRPGAQPRSGNGGRRLPVHLRGPGAGPGLRTGGPVVVPLSPGAPCHGGWEGGPDAQLPLRGGAARGLRSLGRVGPGNGYVHGVLLRQPEARRGPGPGLGGGQTRHVARAGR